MSDPVQGVTHGYADLGDVVIHYVTAGEGEPVVLLHGWPQTWWEWRKLIPALAERYRVIVPDMRGAGDSSRPLDGYDSDTVGGDVHRLMTQVLGHERYALVGHDWGGPAAFSIAARHPEAVSRLAIVDVVIPTKADDAGSGDDGGGGRIWRHPFHRLPDLPEALTEGRERIYLSYVFRALSARPDAISDEELDEYVRAYSKPGAMRAGFAYYRAVHRNVARNEEILAGPKLTMPILAVAGGHRVGRGTTTLESLKRFGTDVRGGVIPDCGHWVPEEKPQELLAWLLPFLAGET